MRGKTKTVVRKHPLAIRWFHWLNFPILLVMTWSGLLIYWANDEYSIKIGGRTLVAFFPDSFYAALGVPYRLAEGMNWHFLFMWLFFFNGLLYVLFLLFSGQWRYLLPGRKSLKEGWAVLLHDFHIRRTEPPFVKYNAAQRIAYTAVLLMGVGSLLTGLAIYKPVQLGWLTWLCGGYSAARLEHFALTVGFVLFFLVHIGQVVKSGWNNFQSMISGFEILKQPKKGADEKGPEPLPRRELSVRQVRVRTALSFAVFLVLALGAWKGYGWIAVQPKVAGTPAPLRSVLGANERLFSAVFDTARKVKEYSLSEAVRRVRVNGNVGLRDALDTAGWRLRVVRAGGDTLVLTMDDIRKLPKRDIVFDFKCIEGWSQVTHWGGVPFSTFLKHYGLERESAMAYLGLETPDGKYYVGVDMPSALQSQTMLCYEMNGAPLPLNQGYPLRFIIPVKYGIKHLKRIGTLSFSQTKPRDYWAERGYDYYAGH